MTPLIVTCLGDLTATYDGAPVPGLTNSKALALWLYVALESNPCPRARLATLFWGDLDDRGARANLRQTLLRLRQLLPGQVAGDPQRVWIPASTDIRIDFVELQDRIAADPPDPKLLLGTKVESLFSGLQLRGVPEFEDWLSARRERCVEDYRSALTRHAQRCCAQDPSLAIELYRRCLGLAPWDETHHRALMESFFAIGDRAAALAQFETCRDALAAELDVAPDPETLALVRRIRTEASPGWRPGQRPAPLAQPVEPAPTPWIDLQSASFGREDEHRLGVDLLTSDNARLVSIVGPGGVGKTHLAVRIGAALRAHFGGRVYLVSLVDLSPAEPADCESLLLRRILEVLAIPFIPGGEQDALVQALRESPTLLVFDNFEGLVAGRGQLATLSSQVPGLRMLVTSRQRLALSSEWILRIDGLPCPGDGDTPEQALSSAAVQLFLQQARRVDDRIDAGAELAAIRNICGLVQGYPLALILAARWLPTLNCGQIAARLAKDLELLSTPDGSAVPDRHTSMSAVLDYSWRLLDDDEKASFAALSVLAGSFLPEAGQAVADARLETLARLESKSLLRRAPGGQLEIHPLLRAVGAARLAENGDAQERARERHAHHFLSGLEDAWQVHSGTREAQVLLRFGERLGDLSLALQFRLAQRPDATPVDAIAGFWTVCHLHGWFREGAALLRSVIARPSTPASDSLRFRLWLTEAHFQLGEHELCHAETVAALRLRGATVFDDRPAVLAMVLEFAQLLLPVGRRGPEPEDAETVARLHNRLAQLFFFEGRRELLLAATLRAARLSSHCDFPSQLASTALVLAYSPLKRRAADFARRAAEALGRGDAVEQAWAHEQLCLYHLMRGELAPAEHHGTVGRSLYWGLRRYRNWGECTSLLANTRLLRGDAASASGIWREARDHGSRLQEAATWLWGLCGSTMMALRRGDPVDGAAFREHGTLLARVVDPNTWLLFHGISAWILAREGQDAAAIADLAAFDRVNRRSPMLSIYATNGFAAAIMAMVVLHGQRAAAQAEPGLQRTVIRDFERFSRTMPGARPTALLLKSVWLEAKGKPEAAARLRRDVRRLLPPECDPDGFASGFVAAGP